MWLDLIRYFKFYISLAFFLITNNFRDFLRNLYLIFSDNKKIISFFIFLPVIFILIPLQINVGFLFFIFYVLIFLTLTKLLKTNYQINCREIPLNTSCLYTYSVLNVLIFVPRAKAYIIVYNMFNIILNKKNSKTYIIFFIIFLSSVVSFLIKIYLFVIIGCSYLSLYVTSEFVINLFNTLSWKYENNTAKYQHIILNCFLNNKDSVGVADELNIIIEKDSIIFNMRSFMKYFEDKVIKPEHLQKAFDVNSKQLLQTSFTDHHFNFSIISPTNKTKNVSKNLTSTSKINVENKEGIVIKTPCKDVYKPNLVGENKYNFLTPTYELDSNNVVRKELNTNTILKMQNFSKNVYNSIIVDKDQPIIYSENGKFYSKENSPTVSEYCKEYHFSVFENIENLTQFEKVNKSFLETKEGKEEYEIYKNLAKGMKIQIQKSLNKDDGEPNSPDNPFS